MRYLAIALALGVTIAPRQGTAQRHTPDVGCVAASGQEELWGDRDSSELANPLITGEEVLARRVSGKYRLLLITTEGAGIGKKATEADAVLSFRPTTDPIGQARRRPGEFQMALTIRRSGYLHERRKPASRNTTAYWRGDYTAPNNFSFIDADPNERPDRFTIHETAAGYYVHAIDDSTGTIRGRWSTGYLMIPRSTPVGTLTEFQSGYFCAWRVAR